MNGILKRCSAYADGKRLPVPELHAHRVTVASHAVCLFVRKFCGLGNRLDGVSSVTVRADDDRTLVVFVQERSVNGSGLQQGVRMAMPAEVRRLGLKMLLASEFSFGVAVFFKIGMTSGTGEKAVRRRFESFFVDIHIDKFIVLKRQDTAAAFSMTGKAGPGLRRQNSVLLSVTGSGRNEDNGEQEQRKKRPSRLFSHDHPGYAFFHSVKIENLRHGELSFGFRPIPSVQRHDRVILFRVLACLSGKNVLRAPLVFNSP